MPAATKTVPVEPSLVVTCTVPGVATFSPDSRCGRSMSSSGSISISVAAGIPGASG